MVCCLLYVCAKDKYQTVQLALMATSKGGNRVCIAGDLLSGDCQSNSDCQGYSDRGVTEYAWLMICGCPGFFRVTLTVRDTLTGGQ